MSCLMFYLCKICRNNLRGSLTNIRRCANFTGRKPVMKSQVLGAFSPTDNQVFVDLTFGNGGHTRELLLSANDVKVFALDRDPEAHALAVTLAEECPDKQLVPLLGKFSDLPKMFLDLGVHPGSIDGFLLETGPSVLQLQNRSRGFHYAVDEPLDMRMDADRLFGLPAAIDVINALDSTPLANIFKKYGEEKHAKKIADAITDLRFTNVFIETTAQLSNLVNAVIGGEYRVDAQGRKLPACYRIFDALRFFVNNELNELNYVLPVIYHFLKPKGKLVTINYRPVEDRIILNHLSGMNMEDPETGKIRSILRDPGKMHSQAELSQVLQRKWTILHKRVLAKPEEIAINPRSSYAKLRAVSKADKDEIEKDTRITVELIFD